MQSNATLSLRRPGAGRLESAIADRGFGERVLVIELAGLGDNVHLIPALRLLREHWPRAEIELLVSDQSAALFRLLPGLARVWAYPWSGRPGMAQNLRWIARLRARRFAVVINTTGSDRSTLLAMGSGAPVRVGRVPADGGPPGWRLAYTDVVRVPYYQDPMYLQKWRGLAGLGFSGEAARLELGAPVALRRALGIDAADDRGYLHVSPFTGHPKRELPPAQIAELLDGVQAQHPQLRVCVSCSPVAREVAALQGVLRLLPRAPWKVFAGTLGADALTSVIAGAALNLSGDTGTLHLARATQTPAVAWFRHHRGEREWIPQGAAYRVSAADGGDESALHGISTAELLGHVRAVLQAGGFA